MITSLLNSPLILRYFNYLIDNYETFCIVNCDVIDVEVFLSTLQNHPSLLSILLHSLVLLFPNLRCITIRLIVFKISVSKNYQLYTQNIFSFIDINHYEARMKWVMRVLLRSYQIAHLTAIY